jgi:hypothetical protein
MEPVALDAKQSVSDSAISQSFSVYGVAVLPKGLTLLRPAAVFMVEMKEPAIGTSQRAVLIEMPTVGVTAFRAKQSKNRVPEARPILDLFLPQQFFIFKAVRLGFSQHSGVVGIVVSASASSSLRSCMPDSFADFTGPGAPVIDTYVVRRKGVTLLAVSPFLLWHVLITTKPL